MSLIPCPICSKSISQDTISYCPDCGQSYHMRCWDENDQTCAIKHCNGCTKNRYIHLSLVFAQMMGIQKSDIDSICPQCTNKVYVLDRYCANCEYEVNPPVKQKTFSAFTVAKWIQKNETGLAIIFIIFLLLVTSSLCGQTASSLYQLSQETAVSLPVAPSKKLTPVFSSDSLPTLISTAVVPTRKSTTIVQPTAMPTATILQSSRHTATATAVPTQEPTPTLTRRPISIIDGLGVDSIVYASNDNGHWSIYAFDVDSGQKKLILGDGRNEYSAPVWSPDGTQLAFHSKQNSNWDIYVMDISDNSVRQLTTHEKGDLFPTWSPDGSQIAFHSTRNGNYDLYSIEVKSLDLRQLTNSSTAESHPDWSPNGSQLAYEININGNSDIYLLNLSDLTTQPLISSAESDISPEWSPNGKVIAFSSGSDENSSELHTINVTGTNLHQLTSNTSNDVFPTWSPDGSEIIYEFWENGKITLHIMNADGSNSRPLMNGINKARFPDWLWQED